MADNFRMIESKKFMWDGKEYEAEAEAKTVAEGYKGDEFETQIFEEEGKWLVYTRREVKEIVLEGAPPV